VKNGAADDDTDMLLPVWALFTLSAGLGVLGLVMAYKRNWAAIVPVLAVLGIAAATILQLRDPLSLSPQYQRATQNWDYIAMLFWSVVLGVTLPVIGSYLGGRRKR
jgi:heme/copper-type cytochrome/quinol oxidase subunit 4